MSENATITATDASPAASPATNAPATQAAPVAAAAPTQAAVTAAPSAEPSSSAMRQALLRAQVAQVLGPVQAPWVLDAAIAASKPDLLADYTGLTGPSRERISTWKAENAFAFSVAQASQAAQVAQPAQTQGAAVSTQPTQAAAEPLPATPGSNTGATSGLSTEQLRRLSQVHVNPSSITSHPDWGRTKAFWGIA